LRFLGEDPWERLDAIREGLPNVCVQMLLRGRNTVGYTPYPEAVTRAFVQEAAGSGIDIFRIFDALNDVSQMRPAIDAVLETGTALAEVAICYSGDLLDPAEDLYTLDYYLAMAERIVLSGAHILAIKDMAGLLRAGAATRLIGALRERFPELPIHVHTHDTPGGQLATLLASAQAGADAVDAASAPMSGTTSQPSLSALVAATAHTELDTGLSLEAVSDLEPYWEAVRSVYQPFESGLPAPTGRVYRHEIPGGQLSNLRQQAISLGLGDHFEKIEDWYAAANRILGRPTKVTPSSKAVGDLALQLVASGADPQDFEQHPERYDIPDSVIGFLAGELGDLPGGWPEPFRTKVLKGRDVRIGETPLAPGDAEAIAPSSDQATRRATLNRLLFPGPTKQRDESLKQYGDLSPVETIDYLYGLTQDVEASVTVARGVQLYVTLNGQLRPINVRDKAVQVDVKEAEKADPEKPGQIPAPFAGSATVKVLEGEHVEAGQPVAMIEAMKMEATITTPVSGTVTRVLLSETSHVEARDLMLEIT
jgi:pyruvate carboxylase